MIEKLLEMQIPSRLEYLGLLAKLVEGLQGPLGLSDEEIFAASTALIEAGTNAIQHGGNLEHSPVRISLGAGDGLLVMEVRDDGHGFDLARIDIRSDHAADPEQIYNSRGRGIFIMRSLMDDVTFNFGRDRGTSVRLELKRKVGGA
jgi:anti-sigma regulatory factor (Ser/Thr protein kinase)